MGGRRGGEAVTVLQIRYGVPGFVAEVDVSRAASAGFVK